MTGGFPDVCRPLPASLRILPETARPLPGIGMHQWSIALQVRFPGCIFGRDDGGMPAVAVATTIGSRRA